MTSYFSVVRYIPSVLAEEFVNIGVLTYGDGRVRGKFLDSWRRAEKFAGESLDNAFEFQEWVEEQMVGWRSLLGPKAPSSTSRWFTKSSTSGRGASR